MKEFLVWFFIGDNPFRLYGPIASLIWIAPIVLWGIWFGFFEPTGLGKKWGLVPLTDILRCVPPVVWVLFFIWFIPHVLRHRP